MNSPKLSAAPHDDITPSPAAAATSVKDTAAQQTSNPAGVRARHVLILGGVTTLGPLATDLYLPALPAVSQSLGTTMSLAQLTLTVCILGLALGQMIAGPVSDARGRRGPLMVGFAVFALASLLCGLATSVATLTALRFVQGLAGASGMVLALAIARDVYNGTALARCISLLMTVNFLAPIAAPVLGGQLLRFTSWRGVFVAIALISLALLLAAMFGLEETLPARQRRSGSITATAGAFRTLLADRLFAGYALTGGFAFGAGIVYISVSPFILQGIYGLSPQRFSLIFGANALGLAAASQLSARLVERTGPRKLLLAGVMGIALGSMVLLALVLGGSRLPAILAALFVIVASLGLIAPNATAMALARTTPQTAGSASALLGLIQLSIGAVVAPLVGLAGTTTAVPMAAAIAAFGLATLTTAFVAGRGT